MSRKLIVAEKPSVGRDIARVLGVAKRGEGYLENAQYVVTWAIGHLVTQCDPGEIDPAWQRWTMQSLPIQPETIPLKVIAATKSQFKIIAHWMNDSDIASIICATDSAREGELIFRYIYQMAKCAKPVERLWISSMTDASIKAGFAALKPDSAYDALYDSAHCRSMADWLVGMNASRAFTVTYGALLSVGRVQTPTLALIVKRDREIASFVPKDYWEIRANFGDYEGLWMDPESRETRCYDKAKAEAVKKKIAQKPAEVIESVNEHKVMPPPQLYDLTTLQREANRRYGYPADKTLKLAQSLYEKHKLLTYPRTDSRYLTDDMKAKVPVVLQHLPEPYKALVNAPEANLSVQSKRFYDNSKVSDHHAIIPTEKAADLSALTQDERNIYDMVARRLISMHYPPYEYDSMKVITKGEGELFKSLGNAPFKQGWKAVEGFTGKKDPKEQKLPPLKTGDTRTVEKASIKACKTKPPEPHTDASILNLMENAGRDIADETLREQMKDSGLGTPATRAATIERLIEVGYAKRVKKTIVSTEKGQKLIDIVPEQIASAVTTGKWEKALSSIAGLSDIDARAAKSGRFMSGIQRFCVFLVDAARVRNPDIVFEKEEYRKKKGTR